MDNPYIVITLFGFFSIWIILGFLLLSLLLVKSDIEFNIPVKDNNIIILFIKGADNMIINTTKGFRKDLSNIKDKAAIRFINMLDKLRGDYDNGKKEKK